MDCWLDVGGGDRSCSGHPHFYLILLLPCLPSDVIERICVFHSVCVDVVFSFSFRDLDHDLDSTDLGDVVVHAGLVELHLIDEVGVLLGGLLLAFVVFHEHLRFDFRVEFLVLDLASRTVELVDTLVIEPSFGLQRASGDGFAVLVDFSLAGLLGVGQRQLLKTLVNNGSFAGL